MLVSGGRCATQRTQGTVFPVPPLIPPDPCGQVAASGSTSFDNSCGGRSPCPKISGDLPPRVLSADHPWQVEVHGISGKPVAEVGILVQARETIKSIERGAFDF